MTMEQIVGVVGENKTRAMRDGDHELARMGIEGDVKTIWDKGNRDEVANARRTFDDLRAKGYLAFHVTGKNGDQGEQMDEFDPDAERMIMIPPMQGG